MLLVSALRAGSRLGSEPYIGKTRAGPGLWIGYNRPHARRSRTGADFRALRSANSHRFRADSKRPGPPRAPLSAALGRGRDLQSYRGEIGPRLLRSEGRARAGALRHVPIPAPAPRLGASGRMQIEAQVLVSLYEPRGEFQLNVETMRRAGSARGSRRSSSSATSSRRKVFSTRRRNARYPPCRER